MIDTAVDAGADDVGRATFTLSEATREDLREIAIEDAMVNAEREAEAIVDSLDTRLVGVHSISTADMGFRPAHGNEVAMDDAAESAPSTELGPGPVSVAAEVKVVYKVE